MYNAKPKLSYINLDVHKICSLFASISSETYCNVIKKGRGIRPGEALATLRFIEEGAAFYHAKRGKITQEKPNGF